MDDYITSAWEKAILEKKLHCMYMTKLGNLVDVTAMNFRPAVHIKKISKREYVLLETGEVKEMRENGERNKRALRKIFRELRQTITANFFDLDDKKLFVTLTYAENMRDEKRLRRDFDLYMKRLRHYLKPEGHALEYLVVIEPQGRGAWHAHLMLKSDKPLFIHHADMEKLWGHGATRTERLESIDNIGAYFIAYFSNVEITDENREKYHVDDSDLFERDGKQYIKGERLKHYPDYMQIWRHSRGIIRPTSEKAYQKLIQEHYEEPHVMREFELEKKRKDESGEEKPLNIAQSQHRAKRSGE